MSVHHLSDEGIDGAMSSNSPGVTPPKGMFYDTYGGDDGPGNVTRAGSGKAPSDITGLGANGTGGTANGAYGARGKGMVSF